MHSTQITPNRLNIRCALAALCACVLALMATTFEVMVVPMFSPITRAMPMSMDNAPVEQSVMVIAMMAAELCTAHVSRPPMSRKSR